MSEKKLKLTPIDQVDPADYRDAISAGSYKIEINTKGEFELWITPAAQEKADSKQPKKPITVKQVEELGLKHGVTVTKRKYTKRENWRDPSKSRHDEANRDDIRYQTRIPKSDSELVDEFLRQSGMTKKELTSNALVEYITRNSTEPS